MGFLIFIFILMPICMIIAIPLGIMKAKQDKRGRQVQEEILKTLKDKEK